MKIAVCDDMRIDQKKTLEYILQYSVRSMLDIEIEAFNSGTELLSAFQKCTYKIIFLDIYMEGLSGVEAAFRIRKEDKDCMIIFTTTSPDYRAEGFEVGAVHYLLKPLAYEGVEEALNRCKRLFIESEKYFNVTVDRHIMHIRMKDVLYMEVFGKMVLIHTIYDILKTYTPLTQIAALLDDGQFLRCQRCFIVNMRFISQVLEEDFQLQNGERIPIHKNGRQKTKNKYSEYFLKFIRRRDDA